MRDSTYNWQKILADGFSSSHDLLTYLGLPTHMGSIAAEQDFKTRVPRGFVARMEANNPQDPLLLQVLAQTTELDPMPGYDTDPLEEKIANPIPGLIHKYAARVLLTITGTCAIHCRYCFRRHFPYKDNNPGQKGWLKALNYIAKDPSIHEIILSGGDPLLASDAALSQLMQAITEIPHIQTVRVHSRIPIVLPERIQKELLTFMNAQKVHLVGVLHCNHPQELDASVQRACIQMKEAGWTLLNQSVLLKGVNDHPDILAQLSQKLFDYGVLPYYLHVLDKVSGAHHFDLPLEEARSIFKILQTQLPGYLVPRLAQENPGQAHKTLLI